MSSGDEASYGLVMPFRCVRSVGGSYDDDAFVAGFRCGYIDEQLGQPCGSRKFAVEPAMREQYDLLAMKHGMSATFTQSEFAADWLWAEFKEQSPMSGVP